MAKAAKYAKVEEEEAAAAASDSGALSAFLGWCADAGLELSAKGKARGFLAEAPWPGGEELLMSPGLCYQQIGRGGLDPLLRVRFSGAAENNLSPSSMPLTILVALLWTRSSLSVSFLNCGAQNWTQYSRIALAFLAAMSHCWLMSTPRLLIPEIKPVKNLNEKIYRSVVGQKGTPLIQISGTPLLFGAWILFSSLWKQLGSLGYCFSSGEHIGGSRWGNASECKAMLPKSEKRGRRLLLYLLSSSSNCNHFEVLKMVATQSICKGQEIFNTYGEMANWQLLHMYGFAEPYPGNTNDAADIQMLTLCKAALQATKTEAQRQLVLEQWDFLCQMEMVGEEGAFVIGWERVLTEEELAMALKVLTMSADEFKEFKEQETQEPKAGEDGAMFLMLSNTTIPRLEASWKKLLFDATLLTLKSYSSDLKAEEEMLRDPQAYSKLSCREKFALQVRYGQKMILHQLLELAS
ncbi:Hypothetical predicted protein [Podarcis lilfordi]|uniref:N-lysine methyltransferase SETD6 n=1 Tax=Podarcis lilfordi TaxID=74358 RepID=A0AA35PE39_9SAUR|nr:Hypothetical predicted protein [Podarcis lilfordi]